MNFTQRFKTFRTFFIATVALCLLLFSFGMNYGVLAEVDDGTGIDYEKFDEDLLGCLCRASCNETWRCGVVACLYAPEPSDESPNCADLSNGVCKCVGFGCGRVHINFELEASQRCLERYGNPLEGEELRSEELRKLDEAIQVARNQVLVAVKAQQHFGDDGDVARRLQELTNLVGERMEMRMEEREDLSDEQREIILNTVNHHLDSYNMVGAGEGSSVRTECTFLWFGCEEVMYIDPTSNLDIIYHELGHLVFEELSSHYEYPEGSSYHEFKGYSSKEHRAFDEAMANIYALDFLGTHTYGSYSEDDEISLHKLREAGTHGEGYRYDFATNNLFIARNENSDEEIDVSADTGDSVYIGYYGVLNDEERRKHHEVTLREIDRRLSRIKSEVVVLDYQLNRTPAREKYPSLYEERNVLIDPLTGQEMQELKGLDINREEIEERLEEFRRESANLVRTKSRIQARLNPPAFSSRAELAVSRLLYETTGGRDEIDRIGQIQSAVDTFSEVKGRGPKSELEFLQGLLHGKDRDSEEFQNIVDIIQGDKLRRDYDIEELILN